MTDTDRLPEIEARVAASMATNSYTDGEILADELLDAIPWLIAEVRRLREQWRGFVESEYAYADWEPGMRHCRNCTC